MTDLENKLNTYGKKIVSLIYKEYKNSLGNKELQFFNLSQNNFIVVDPQNTSDFIPPLLELKEDGYIHIYPYQETLLDKDEEQINRVITPFLPHEIFRYLITLNQNRNSSPQEESFASFLTEGLLECYSKDLSKKYNLPTIETDLQKNTDFAKHLLENIPKDMDKDKFVFHYNINLMCEAYQIKTKKSLIEKYEQEYLKENGKEKLLNNNQVLNLKYQNGYFKSILLVTFCFFSGIFLAYLLVSN